MIGRRRVPAPVARRDHDEQHALVNDGAGPPLKRQDPEFSLEEADLPPSEGALGDRFSVPEKSVRHGPPKRKLMPALTSWTLRPVFEV